MIYIYIIISCFLQNVFAKNISIPNHINAGFILQNDYRKMHNSQLLTFDQIISNTAQNFAEKLAISQIYEHGMLIDGNNRKLGQNIYIVFNANKKNSSEIIKMAIKNWYKEEINYDYNNPVFSPKTGHFTQMIWNSTILCGIGYFSKENRKIVVADYWPAGNVQGKFQFNVFPSK